MRVSLSSLNGALANSGRYRVIDGVSIHRTMDQGFVVMCARHDVYMRISLAAVEASLEQRTLELPVCPDCAREERDAAAAVREQALEERDGMPVMPGAE